MRRERERERWGGGGGTDVLHTGEMMEARRKWHNITGEKPNNAEREREEESRIRNHQSPFINDVKKFRYPFNLFLGGTLFPSDFSCGNKIKAET